MLYFILLFSFLELSFDLLLSTFIVDANCFLFLFAALNKFHFLQNKMEFVNKCCVANTWNKFWAENSVQAPGSKRERGSWLHFVTCISIPFSETKDTRQDIILTEMYINGFVYSCKPNAKNVSCFINCMNKHKCSLNVYCNACVPLTCSYPTICHHQIHHVLYHLINIRLAVLATNFQETH